MSSTTAEVQLYFEDDSNILREAIDKLRFSQDPPLETAEIIAIMQPVWTVAWNKGWSVGYDDASD